MPDDPDLEGLLREHFMSDDHVSEQAIGSAKAAFGLRDLDAELAALNDAELVSRGDDDVLRFTHGQASVAVRVEPGRIEVTVAPVPLRASIDSAAGSVEVPLDAAGGGALAWVGTGWLRIDFDDRAVVTDPFTVPAPD